MIAQKLLAIDLTKSNNFDIISLLINKGDCMKFLIKNNDYELFYKPEAVNRYVVYHTSSMSPSDDLKLKTSIAQSPNFTKKIKSYFTKAQVDSAIAIVHGLNYANKKFKF